jgi:hypothetical protein
MCKDDFASGEITPHREALIEKELASNPQTQLGSSAS